MSHDGPLVMLARTLSAFSTTGPVGPLDQTYAGAAVARPAESQGVDWQSEAIQTCRCCIGWVSVLPHKSLPKQPGTMLPGCYHCDRRILWNRGGPRQPGLRILCQPLEPGYAGRKVYLRVMAADGESPTLSGEVAR